MFKRIIKKFLKFFNGNSVQRKTKNLITNLSSSQKLCQNLNMFTPLGQTNIFKLWNKLRYMHKK